MYIKLKNDEYLDSFEKNYPFNCYDKYEYNGILDSVYEGGFKYYEDGNILTNCNYKRNLVFIEVFPDIEKSIKIGNYYKTKSITIGKELDEEDLYNLENNSYILLNILHNKANNYNYNKYIDKIIENDNEGNAIINVSKYSSMISEKQMEKMENKIINIGNPNYILLLAKSSRSNTWELTKAIIETKNIKEICNFAINICDANRNYIRSEIIKILANDWEESDFFDIFKNIDLILYKG
jgi:hypothetical protein